MNWQLNDIDETAVCSQYHVSHLVGKVLLSASLNDDQIKELLHGDDHLTSSHADCLNQCAALIMHAKKEGMKVFIGGDYDTDGVTATAIMKDTLDRLGIECGYYIPDRFREGYGLSAETVELAVQKGYQLIITVDNGVKAHKAIDKAHELGVKIIITDHHEISEPVEADLVVHPVYMEPEFAYLSGAGVALEISRTLLNEVPSHTALAAIAAIADVMPLWKETRKIVKRGLNDLRQGALPAVTALLYPGTAINQTALSFQIIPKLNSVGRMNDISNVNTLVPFLLMTDGASISRYALQLNQVNNARRDLSRKMTDQAIEMIHEEDNFELLYRPDFQEGICGLTAGRIANQYHKPTIVLSASGGMIKGSGRSTAGFDLYSFFNEGFEDLLTAFGGHEMAVGISMKEKDLEQFRQRVAEKMTAMNYSYELPVSEAILIRSEDMTLDEIASLEVLQPLPKELGKPMFAIRSPAIAKVFESPKVAKYTCTAANGSFDAVLYQRLGLEKPDAPSLFIGSISINRWRNQITPQMELNWIE